MNEFVAILKLPSERIPPHELSRLFDDDPSNQTALSRATETAIVERAGACLAVRHPSTTIEDREAAQLIHDPQSAVDFILTGRLDNRQELIGPLGIEDPDASDARVAFAAYAAWGERCFERLIGAFAILIFDARRHCLLCARDALGDRSLYYHRGADQLVVASELSTLLRHPAVSRTFDDVALAHFFAAQAPPPGGTFFADVREVPPGHTLTLYPDRQHMERYWPPGDLGDIRYRRDTEYVDHFRSLLQESVRCRLPSQPAAILMSGGLDSTSVAAVAAQELSGSSPEARLSTISWVFDEFERADERRFIHPMIEKFDLAAHFIVGDGEWPLRDLPTWPIRLEAPYQGLYCRLTSAAYETARATGVSVLLTGEFGDHLYVDREYWLRDLIVARRPSSVWREVRSEFSNLGLGSILRAGSTRSALARALGWRGRRGTPPAWLTPFAGRLLEASSRASRTDGSPIRSRERGLPHPGILDPRCASAASLASSTARRAGIEVRRPFRDRRLIEFFLSSPAHILYRPGSTKWVLREAMRGILPETVRLRRQVSSLMPLAARGLVEKEKNVVAEILRNPEALWRRFVNADWLATAYPSRIHRELDGIESVIAWQCVCSHLWSEDARKRERNHE